jgi:hypothetical protein
MARIARLLKVDASHYIPSGPANQQARIIWRYSFIMKLATSPRPFTFVIISLSLLIVQFGFINHFLAFPEQGQPPTPEPTQSIPETYLPVVIDTAANQNSSGAGIASSPQLADDEFLPYTETVAENRRNSCHCRPPLGGKCFNRYQ